MILFGICFTLKSIFLLSLTQKIPVQISYLFHRILHFHSNHNLRFTHSKSVTTNEPLVMFCQSVRYVFTLARNYILDFRARGYRAELLLVSNDRHRQCCYCIVPDGEAGTGTIKTMHQRG